MKLPKTLIKCVFCDALESRRRALMHLGRGVCSDCGKFLFKLLTTGKFERDED